MLPYIDIQHLSKRFGDLLLFENISFSVSEGQRVGLIAKNGSGKSTLLDILCGREDYDGGEVVCRRDLRIGYLPQSPHYASDMTVIDACFSQAGDICKLVSRYEECLETPGNPGLSELIDEMDRCQAWDFEQRAKQILGKLKIHDFKQRMGQLSGGQVKRVALANVLLSEPELLVLDEPTNHLDIDMIEWLETFLKRSGKTLLMVTHDRYFLENVCDVILELDRNSMYSYRGNYAYYLEKREERIHAANAQIARAANLYRKELDWMRRMPCARGTKAKYRKDAFYELEALARQKMEERVARIEVKSGYIGSKIFEADYVSKAFPSRDPAGAEGQTVILKDFYYNFTRYEKMGIVGGNGTGKSTFIKLLLGLEKPDDGRFVIGETVRFGYFSQDDILYQDSLHTEFTGRCGTYVCPGGKIDDDMKVIDAVRRIAETIDLGGGRKLTAMQFLTHFLFQPSRQQDYIRKLSGGERRRLQLCMVLMRNPNFLVLDEPTNDLDIPTLQILEEYLADFKGCVIVVSHDRYFMDKVVDHLLVFKGGGVVKDFPGNYSQYREWSEWERIQAEEAAAASVKPKAQPATVRRSSGERKRRLTYAERREMEQLEQEIEALEKEKQDLENRLCSGGLPVEELTAYSKRLPQLTDLLDEKSMRWLELSEIE